MAYFTNLYCIECGKTWWGVSGGSQLCSECLNKKNEEAWENYRNSFIEGKTIEERIAQIERGLYELSKATRSLEYKNMLQEPIG